VRLSCCSVPFFESGVDREMSLCQVRSRYTDEIGGVTAILNGEVDVLGVYCTGLV
jgi:hypothetical protein